MGNATRVRAKCIKNFSCHIWQCHQFQLSSFIKLVFRANRQKNQSNDQIKSLGVILASDLSWNAHISSVSSKVHGALHTLRTRGWLVQTLVYHHLDYACLVFNQIPAYICLKLQRLTNAGIRFIFNLRRESSITTYWKAGGHWKQEDHCF